MLAKIVKGIKNIFIKVLARKKSLCIFALGFRITIIRKQKTDIRYHFKDTKQ